MVSHAACPLPQGLVDWRKAVAALRAAGYDGWLNLHAEYDGRYAPAGDRTGPTPRAWEVEPTGNLDETAPALELLEPDIAYLAKIVAGS